MRVALVNFCKERDKKIIDIVKKLEAGAVSRSHQVDVFNGYEDMISTKLSFYEYIVAIVHPLGLINGKIPARVSAFFSTAGYVTGKKGCALVIKSGLRSFTVCRSLMQVMEKQGIKVDYFEVIKDVPHAIKVSAFIG